ncbi:MAG: argininosuccinate lyase [Candidatus Bathyarchaeia archaeon]
MSELLRKGRLSSVRKDVVEFTSSIKNDKKLLKHVININKAHVLMLMETGIIHKVDGAKILNALEKLDKDIKIKGTVEDVHMVLEEEVINIVGADVGGNLNLAKSRNDQVATAIRMKLREEILNLSELVIAFQEALVQVSEKNLETLIPGYTHLQPAQPTTFAHYLVAQFDALERNMKRIEEAFARVDLCPMGAGALATTSFSISRERVATLLGFSGIVENSLDAVSTRDFLLEVLAILSIMAVDVSRFVEDLIIWSSMEFGLIDFPDQFSSTSSIMPQKKNPEVLEVTRARMSHILGNFIAATVTLKNLPSAYNLDLQEITPKLWDSIETINKCLKMFLELLINLKVNENLLNKGALSFLTATELANVLVRNHNVPFRTSHKIVGALVRTLIENGKSLRDTTPELLVEISKKFLKSPLSVSVEEIHDAIDPSSFVESHKVRGGPSKMEVNKMLSARKEILDHSKKWVSEKRLKLTEAEANLNSLMKSSITSNLSNRKV